MRIGVRHDPAGEPAARELGAQRRHPRAARPAFGAILERLEAGLEHRRQSMGCAVKRQRAAGRRSTSVTQPSSGMRCSSMRPRRGRPPARRSLARQAARRAPAVRPERRGAPSGSPAARAARAGYWRIPARTARARAGGARPRPAACTTCDEGADAVEPRIVARDPRPRGRRCRSRAPARAAPWRPRWRARRCRCRRRGCTAACACVMSCCRAPAVLLDDAVERDQAAAGGAVMAGAEGERRLDLDADAVARDARASRARRARRSGRRRPAAAGSPHPILRGQRLEDERVGGRRAGGERDQRAHRRLVRRLAEMHGERAAPVRLLEARGRHLVRGRSSRRARRRWRGGGARRSKAAPPRWRGAEQVAAWLGSFRSSPIFTASRPQRQAAIHSAINTLSSVHRQDYPPAYPQAFQCLFRAFPQDRTCLCTGLSPPPRPPAACRTR